jgi:hypothetical protein
LEVFAISFQLHFSFLLGSNWGYTPENKKLNFVVENNEGVSTFTLLEKRKEEIKGYNVKPKPKFRFTHKQNNGFYDTISKSQNFAYLQMNKA